MDDDQMQGAVCAGSDLTARLWAELARADDCLALAMARLDAAMAMGLRSQVFRAEARASRRHRRSLQRVLAGMPGFHGGQHAVAVGN